MKKTLFASALLVSLMGLTSVASAATVGNLNWDGSSDFITTTGSSTTYVQLGKYADLTYQETLTQLSTSSTLAGFRIATQSDAFVFYNSLINPVNPVSDTPQLDAYITELDNEVYIDGSLGDNVNEDLDMAFFLSDYTYNGGIYAGIVRMQASQYQFGEAAFLLAESDAYSNQGQGDNPTISWLLVKDGPFEDGPFEEGPFEEGPAISPVPIPAAAFMFAPALLGFAALRRKKRPA